MPREVAKAKQTRGEEMSEVAFGRQRTNGVIAVIALYMGRAFARGTGWWAVWGPGCVVTTGQQDL